MRLISVSEVMFITFQEEGEFHPSCPHGPMILFWKKSKELDGYYSCSAFRDFKDCPVKVPFSKSEDFKGEVKFLKYHNGIVFKTKKLVRLLGF